MTLERLILEIQGLSCGFAFIPVSDMMVWLVTGNSRVRLV